MATSKPKVGTANFDWNQYMTDLKVASVIDKAVYVPSFSQSYTQSSPLQEEYVERTLVLLKPDAFERNLVGEILDIIDRRNLALIGSKIVHMDPNMVKKHYKNHVQKNFFPDLVTFMTSGPSMALVYEGKSACQALRQLIGEKHPTNSPPGSIRGKYASEYPRNLIHGSDDQHEAAYEINLYFTDTELYGGDYKKNQKKIEAAKSEKIKAEKASLVSLPVKAGDLIPYPEQVQKNWIIVDSHAMGTTYHVLGVSKQKGGGVEITLCNSSYVDNPSLKAAYSVVATYDDYTWQSDGWKRLM